MRQVSQYLRIGVRHADGSAGFRAVRATPTPLDE